ncbi:MAG: ABC transporter ATP-binding protein/permease, partial [Desulfobacteraceae bacterium]|nr:ABC transporter ATP-binding protein/permease [Desulfobacteraceae bacterium]
MIDTIKKFRDLMDARERRNAVVLFLLILVTGVMEAVGVASIMPFLSVLSNPETIRENAYLAKAYESLGFSGTDSFLIFLGAMVFCVVVFGLCLKALTQYALARFSHMRNYSFSSRLLHGYLARPYSWFLNRHSADLGKTILSEVWQVINHALLPATQLIAQAVITFCLIVLLLIVNSMVALIAALLLGGGYTAIYLLLRKYLNWIGADRVRANRERYQIAQEALGGIKEVKAAGLEWGYLRSFFKPARRFAKHQAANMIIGQIPRFFLEALALGGLLLVILLLLASGGGNIDEILPTLGVFAFAGMRLLPAMQMVYQNATKLRFGKPALDSLYADMSKFGGETLSTSSLRAAGSEIPLPLQSQLEMRKVSFTYPGAKQPAIENLDLCISANTTVGLAGTTGAGKTTAVDLIMGLLAPNQGEIIVDDTVITPENVRCWQRSLGYVPQHIFLADDTVAANIAFGVAQDEIDMGALQRAAKLAELHEFVVSELSNGYETTIGERGVRLSGGQRQRIGIARAMYHDPDVLIMDEATSALDNLTEKAVMDAVHNLSKQKTIILIAHRLSTVKNCDRI